MGCTIASFTHPKDSYADKRSETIRSISKMGRQVDWFENIGRGITIIPKRRGKISLKARQRLQAYPNIWHTTTNRSTSPDKPWTNIRIKKGPKKKNCTLFIVNASYSSMFPPKDIYLPQVDAQWGTLAYRSCLAQRAPQSSMPGIRCPAISNPNSIAVELVAWQVVFILGCAKSMAGQALFWVKNTTKLHCTPACVNPSAQKLNQSALVVSA